MKRYILCVFLLAGLLSAAGSAGAASPVKGSFKYCSDPTFPPMESKTAAGKPVGFDIDMANAIAKYWKVKAKFVETADRLKQFPAVSYMKTHSALVVAAGNPKAIKGPNDLSGKTVAVQAGP